MGKTLVFGASLKPNRYSNLAVQRLVENNKDTMAFGPKRGTISGIEVSTNFDDFQGIHTISLYLGPKNQPEFYQSIIDLKPKRVIFNPGTENPEFYKLLKDNKIEVEVACTLVLLATEQY